MQDEFGKVQQMEPNQQTENPSTKNSLKALASKQTHMTVGRNATIMSPVGMD